MENGQANSRLVNIRGLADMLLVDNTRKAKYIIKQNVDFPKAIYLSPRNRCWKVDEVQKWLDMKRGSSI
jgi:predicted DNA-binding transcriptional regulator AlpA